MPQGLHTFLGTSIPRPQPEVTWESAICGDVIGQMAVCDWIVNVLDNCLCFI